MALVVSISFCETCDGIVVTDTTGTYNAVSRPNGYGAPNPDFGSVTPFTVSFTPPGATAPIYTLDLLADPPAADSDGDREWLVSAGDMGLTEITSGVWTMTWVAGDDDDVLGGVPQGDTVEVMMYREIMADVDEQVLTAMQGCDEDKREKAFMLKDLMCGAVHMAGCGDATKAQTMIEYIRGQLAQCC